MVVVVVMMVVMVVVVMVVVVMGVGWFMVPRCKCEYFTV